jgi:hypothetical protein
MALEQRSARINESARICSMNPAERKRYYEEKWSQRRAEVRERILSSVRSRLKQLGLPVLEISDDLAVVDLTAIDEEVNQQLADEWNARYYSPVITSSGFPFNRIQSRPYC